MIGVRILLTLMVEVCILYWWGMPDRDSGGGDNGKKCLDIGDNILYLLVYNKGDVKMMILWVVLVSICLSIIVKAGSLMLGDYPRTEKISNTQDVIGLIVQGVLLVWVLITLNIL